jgi:long-chain fatty acid transport protein
MKLKKIAALLTVAGLSAPAFATNGMNMEGYGPVATGMGGASMAYDNGTAGLINNPATLGLMKSGTSRLDVAIGGLHPDVASRVAGFGSASSGGDAYYMPAIGYVRRDGNWTWGAGMMSQGGMGTEWGKSSFLSGGSGNDQRTELGVGRVIFPLVYTVSDNLTIGGSLDYVWGGLDMSAQLSSGQLGAMVANGPFGGVAMNANQSRLGAINATGGMVAALGTPLTATDWGYFNFSDGTNKFSQATKTSGMAGNVGMVFKATPALSVGAVYHARTNLSDMTGSGQMVMMVGSTNGANGVKNTMAGNYRVVDFQWPETFAVGFSYQANDKWQIAADYKNIAWSNTMQKFHFVFTNAAGSVIGMLNQNWDDQDVLQIGASYKWNDQLTVRFGANLSTNPIPEANVNPLFPATVKSHFTFGAGYAMSKASSFDFSATFAPKSDTNWMPSAADQAASLNTLPPKLGISHAQANWQLMFSQRF